MLVLLPLLWLWSVWARDESPSKDSKYVIKRISSCPEVGYYFKREGSPNSLSGTLCYLCFCHNDGTAVCWKRENKRCDARHYKHGLGKRDTRVRRSPLGIGDIFFRDAARDIFDKQLPQVCKPYETSFSKGCPPADWCTGCTVCDCDANGRWDCHVLSFCPDKKDKNKMKKSKQPLKGPALKRTTPTKKTTTKPAKRSTTKRPAKSNKKQIKNTSRTKPNNNVQKRNKASAKPLVVKKNPASKKPIIIKKDHSQITLNKNETAKIAQEVYKKVASAVQKMITKKFAANLTSLKNIQKRSLEKKTQPCVKNSKNAKKNVNGKFKSAGPNKKQYKKVLPKQTKAQKKKYESPKKKVAPKKYSTGNKNVKRNNPNKPSTVKKVIPKPTKKSTKPPKRFWRTKREIIYNMTNNNETRNSYVLDTESPLKVNSNSTITGEVNINNVTGINNYYKYSVITPDAIKNTTHQEEYKITYVANELNTNNHTHIVSSIDKIKSHDFNKTPKLQPNINIDNKNKSKLYINISVDDVSPEFNDLKFSKRLQIKYIKNNRLFHKLLGVNASSNAINITNTTKYTNVSDSGSLRSNTRELIKIVIPKPVRVYDKSKIVNTIRYLTRNKQKAKLESNFKERIYNKIDDLQNVLKKLLVELRKNNTMKVKPQRFNVIRYLKKFFRKVFRKRSGKGVVGVNNKEIFNKHIIDTICENFEHCDRNKFNNPTLHKKIKELYSESFVILRIINILKGLLQFLNDSKKGLQLHNQHLKTISRSYKLNDDIHKLSAILKDRYTSDHELSSTELTQIQYIKKNTKDFIAAVGRFASKLDEIILILTQKPRETKKKPVTRDIKKKAKYKLSDLGADYFIKLRDLLDKYTILQGALVERMQQSLEEYKNMHDSNTKNEIINKNRNSTISIVKYSNNIIRNLKKLKNLAAVLTNSKSRRKRDILRDDDAMDYLLTLMEYLLKQNHPLDTAPVNDGIDLLIEAIKNAPDVKPTQKKVLNTIPLHIQSVENEDLPFNLSKEDSSLDITKMSKEDNETNATRSETLEFSYQERDDDQSRGNVIFEDTNTEAVYYKKDTEISETRTTVFETTVVPGAYGFKRAQETTEHNNFEKLENAIKDEEKKIEVFNGDADDEESNIEQSSTTVSPDAEEKEFTIEFTNSVVSTTAPVETTEFKLPEVKEKQNSINYVGISGSSDGEKRLAFDWLDEGDEQTSKEVNPAQNKTELTPKQVTTKTLTTTMAPLHLDNISSITKEVSDENGRKKKANAEEIMYKKQMDLLNSLDYGTERTDTDETESKDGDERYSGDVFQTYF